MPRSFHRLPGSRAAVSADVDEEIRSHIEQRFRQLVSDGMPPDEAYRVALQRFGDVDATRRAMRTSANRHVSRLRRRDWLGALATDARHTARQLRRAPGLAAVIILTLGLGIGATATMFGIVDRLLLRAPPHIREPERVGRLYTSHIDDASRPIDQDEVSYLRFTQLRDGARGLAEVAAMGTMPVIAGRGGTSRRISAGFVSGNFWTVLGVRPELGRVFGPDEDVPPDGSNVVVLGHAYWKIARGGDTAVIGKVIDLGARRFTVIGVAPPGFHGAGAARIDVWLPVTALRTRETRMAADWHAKNDLWWLALYARLAPEVTPERAEAALTATFARVHMGGQIADSLVRARARVVFGPLLEERGPRQTESTRIATWLAAIAGIVLLLACSNVANLLLVRAIRRRREIAVRLALGVSRARLVSQLLVEGLLLSGGGAVLGVAIATVGSRALWKFVLPGAPAVERVFDGRILGFAIVAAVLAGVLASLAPSLYALRQDVNAMMKSGPRDGSARRLGLRGALLAGQCALSMALLLGAGLFIRSVQHARATPLGFDAQTLIAITAERRDATPLPGGMSAVYRQLAERLRGMPGVMNAATTTQIPFSMSASTSMSVPGVDSAALEALGTIRMNPVGDDYFATMGTRILRGRALMKSDGAGAPRVMVVSDSFARALWPGADALGKCVKVGDGEQPCSIVVGVAENIHQYEVRPEPALQYWFPEAQDQGGNSGAFAVMVRVTGDVRTMIPTLRRALEPLTPRGTYLSVYAIGDVVERVTRPWRLGALVLTAFGVLGLVIAGMGLYSVLAYTVSQRSAELGLRMALGASPGSLLRRVMADGMRVTTVGIIVGLAAALVAGRSINAVLFGVTTVDPVVAPIAVGTLLVAALAASAVPAWRASRVDPAQSLRGD
jgi:putative ABC transport system permease protein